MPVGQGAVLAPADASGRGRTVHPLVRGEPLALYGVSAGAGLVVAVGDCGLLLEREGGDWRSIQTGLDRRIRAVAHARGVWFAVGPPGVMLVRKDGAWRAHDLPNAGPLRAAWAESAAHALFVGDEGTIIRWQNGAARREPSGTTSTLLGVWGSPTGAAYAVGLGGTVLSYDGSTWSPVSLPAHQNWYGVWGPGDGGGVVWIVGAGRAYRYDGHLWSDVSPNALLAGVWARSSDDVFAVGPGGLVLHYDGSGWAQERAVRDEALMAVSGFDETVVAVSLGGTIIERTRGTWRKVYDGTRTSAERCER